MDDDELVSAVARGDHAALRQLFLRHAPWLSARLRVVLPPADVEDVLQETFLAVWRGAGGYRRDGAGGWIWGIGRRQAALWLRRRGRVELLPLVEDGPTAEDPADLVVSRTQIADALDALGPEGSPQRETWRLMYLEDRTVAEVAELTGVPAGTVKSRAHHARRILRAVLRLDDPMISGGR